MSCAASPNAQDYGMQALPLSGDGVVHGAACMHVQRHVLHASPTRSRLEPLTHSSTPAIPRLLHISKPARPRARTRHRTSPASLTCPQGAGACASSCKCASSSARSSPLVTPPWPPAPALSSRSTLGSHADAVHHFKRPRSPRSFPFPELFVWPASAIDRPLGACCCCARGSPRDASFVRRNALRSL